MLHNDGRIARAAREVKLLILDVDGVLTDGSIILDGGGNELKRFHVRDGHGIKMLQRAGVQVAIITGRSSEAVRRRAEELGIEEVHQGSRMKTEAYEEMLARLGLRDEETAFVGDDVVDIPILRRAGLSIAVADATEEAKAAAMAVTEGRGGRGAVREVTDFLLKAKGLWDDAIARYFEA
ncbi:MAG: hypothetical protein Kow0025_23520 [Thermodesulfovibrionales bacterium]